MRQINLHDLKKTTETINVKRAMVFDRILEMCHGKIKRTAYTHRAECYYTIPEYVVGLPLYNRKDCIEYVVDALRTNGFKVEEVSSVCIRIDWSDESSKSPLGSSRQSQNPPSLKHDNFDSVSDMLLLGYDNDATKRKFILNVD